MKKYCLNKILIIFLIFVLFFCLGFFSFGQGFVFAQEKQNQVGLSVSPLNFEFSANPGETIENKIKVSNPTQKTVSVKMEVEDFTAMGEEGEVKVEEQHDHTYSLKKWVTVNPLEFTLTPGDSRVVSFKIVVPQNAEPGGKYGSILATVTGIVSPTGTGASIQPKVGALVLLSVSGKIVEKLDIKEFSAPKLSEKGPIKFALRFENKGTVHLRPRGIVTITDIFGKKLADLEIPQKNVLPGAVRKVEVQWNKKWLFGRYQATFVGNYGSQNTPISATLTFWVIPWKISLVVIVVLILILAIIIRTRKKIKRAEQILKEHKEREASKRKEESKETEQN